MSFGLNVSKLFGFLCDLIFKLLECAKLMLLVITENSTVATYPFSLSSTDDLEGLIMDFTYSAHFPVF